MSNRKSIGNVSKYYVHRDDSSPNEFLIITLKYASNLHFIQYLNRYYESAGLPGVGSLQDLEMQVGDSRGAPGATLPCATDAGAPGWGGSDLM